MIKYLELASKYPFAHTAGEIYYYGISFFAVVFFLFLAAKKLVSLGYPKNRVMLFAAVFIPATCVLGYLGSRAASMFYRPFHEWSIPFLIENILHSSTHTFHGALILPVIFLIILCRIFKFKAFEGLDAFFLYVPLVHALGRSACLVVGCCWGVPVRMYVFNSAIGFPNPVPLYAIVVNVVIFFFLRRVYTRVYAAPTLRKRYTGAVLAGYLLLYPPARIIFEVFRMEPRIYEGLTQAQISMGLFMLAGAAVLLVIRRRYTKQEAGAEPELTNLFSMAILLVVLVIANFLIIYFTRQTKMWPWPIQPVHSLAEAYSRVLYYMPMMIVPIFCLFWLRKFREPILPWFQWKQFSYVFLIGLALSVYYSVKLLILKDVDLRGPAFWPPVLIMSIMNAPAEEIMYRLGLYNLLKRASYPRLTANIVQAIVFSLIHFMIAGVVFGIFAFIYGFVLGIVAERNKSIIPSIICHFIIDWGTIGMPILRH
ncbi:MAG: prolipoprotein diacylglyceryl transferase family protein [Desulfobacterales bacterium]